MYFISGVLWRLGLSLQLAYLIWTPIALLVLFLGCAWYVARMVPEGRGRQTAALALAIFYQTPAYALAMWTGHLSLVHRLELLLATDDATPSLQLWGFAHTAIAVGAMAIFLICAERLLAGPAPRRWMVGAALAGLWLAWLHPWQAATVLVVLGAMFVLRPPRRRYLTLTVPVIATVAPLIYGLALSHYDVWWHTFKVDSQITGTAPWWALLLSFGPLALFAGFGLRRPDDDREWMLVLWVAGTVAVYFLVPEFPPHALAGVTVPLAVLAVRGFTRASERLRLTPALTAALGTLCVAAVTAPALYNHLQSVPRTVQRSVLGNLSLSEVRLTDDQNAALVYLDHARGPGGVLAPQLLSIAIPGFTGRPVFVGHGQWEPPLNVALGTTFYGAASAAQRRSIVRASGARFVIGDCHATPTLGRQLSGLVVPVWRRGCVTVYETRGAA
jgi:hypothetical protein